ncbi:MAG: MBL fold metallo-hydrolase [Pseudomonadota bacterium]
MDYACIGSGSNGNAAVVRHGSDAFLLDCGLTIKETERRLTLLEVSPGDLNAIVVTHEHGDHLRGVGPFARKYKLPVWMTRGTYRRARDKKIAELNFYAASQPFSIGVFVLHPFCVPHDAAEACQFSIHAENSRLGILTDLGKITPHVIESVQHVQALVIECNHDPQMLRDGPYPPALQARVGGDYGHLSNAQAAQILQSVDSDGLEFILLAHLSEQNNTSELAIEAVSEVLTDGAARVSVLSAADCSRWFSLPRLPDGAGF